MLKGILFEKILQSFYRKKRNDNHYWISTITYSKDELESEGR